MFALTMGPGMNMGFPDVCKTPLGPVITPLPYPNISMTPTTAPAAYPVLTECLPTVTQISFGLMSNGDEPGVLLGVVSNMIMGQTCYTLGNTTILALGTQVQRLSSITMQNCMGVVPNCTGMTTCPSQCTVLTLG